MHRFSIILPVYNGLPFLKHCIESIYSQTYPDFDLIVLDSGSNDGSVEYIRSLNKSNIFFHSSEARLSIEENWGRIKEIPKAEFMTIIGQDDILYPHFLENINKEVGRNNDATLWHAHFDYIDAFSEIIRPSEAMPSKLDLLELTKLFLDNKIDMMGTGYVMRSADYDRLGGIPVKYPSLLFADFELWFRLTGLSYQVISSKTLFAFRIHQSTTTTSKNDIYLAAFGKFIEFLCELKSYNIELKKIIEDKTEIFIDKYTQRVAHRLIKTNIVDRRPDETVKHLLEVMKHFANKLKPQNNFSPNRRFSVKIAAWIDSNMLTRKLFLYFKRLFPKAFLR